MNNYIQTKWTTKRNGQVSRKRLQKRNQDETGQSLQVKYNL